VLYVVAALIYVLDQLFKWLIRANLPENQGISVIPHVLAIYHIQNPGGAFSILPNQTWLFVLVALVVVVAVVVVHRRIRPNLVTQIGLGLLLGGAIGNMTDRIVQHTVTDYVSVYIINFPIFNLADAAIDVGVILLLISSFLSSTPAQSESTSDSKTEKKEDVHS
jgi:signal peptidase II